MAAPKANEAAERVIAQRLIAGDTNSEIRRRLKRADLPGFDMTDQAFTHYRQREDIKTAIASAQDAARTAGAAIRANRISSLQERRYALLHVVEERSMSEDMLNVPGGRSGYLTKQVKGVGKGEDFELIESYEVDVALSRELREIEKQIAQELGEWTERRDVTTDGKPLENVVILRGVSMDEI